MKKIALFLLVALICFATFAGCGETIEPEEPVNLGYAYELSEDGTFYKVVRSNIVDDFENVTEITIEAEHDGKPVAEIAARAFCDYKNLKKVTLSDSVKTVGKNAFFNTTVEEIDFAKVEDIGSYACAACYSLKEVIIPDTVTSLGDKAFCMMPVENMDINLYGGTNVPNKCNVENLAIEKIVIGNGVTEIPAGCFANCFTASQVTFGNKVSILGKAAFFNCGFTSLELPQSLTIIGEECFVACRNFDSVVIPASVTMLGIRAFARCNDMEMLCEPKGNEYNSNPNHYGHDHGDARTFRYNESTVWNISDWCSVGKLTTVYFEGKPNFTNAKQWFDWTHNEPDFRVYVLEEHLDAFKSNLEKDHLVKQNHILAYSK